MNLTLHLPSPSGSLFVFPALPLTSPSPFPSLAIPPLSPLFPQILQQHFSTLLRARLSPLLQLTLELLLEGMETSSLAAVLWRDLRCVMRVNKESDLLAQTMLPVQEVWPGKGRGLRSGGDGGRVTHLWGIGGGGARKWRNGRDRSLWGG